MRHVSEINDTKTGHRGQWIACTFVTVCKFNIKLIVFVSNLVMKYKYMKTILLYLREPMKTFHRRNKMRALDIVKPLEFVELKTSSNDWTTPVNIPDPFQIWFLHEIFCEYNEFIILMSPLSCATFINKRYLHLLQNWTTRFICSMLFALNKPIYRRYE